MPCPPPIFKITISDLGKDDRYPIGSVPVYTLALAPIEERGRGVRPAERTVLLLDTVVIKSPKTAVKPFLSTKTVEGKRDWLSEK